MPTISTVSNSLPKFLSLEIAKRMEDKLSIVRMEPRVICHLGQVDIGLLSKRYPRAKHFAANPRLLTKGLKKIFFNLINRPCLEAVTDKVDLIWSNLELQNDENPELLIKKWRELLKVDALLMFSYMGPDTGKEITKYFDSKDLKNVPSAWDMHDVGDTLLKAGFCEPVMDMEYITLDYETLDLLIADAFDLGLLNTRAPVRSALPKDLPLKITLEVVYGHAWTPTHDLSKAEGGYATISPDQIVRAKR
jgi:malonyl-CoA O-methyltransferase